MPMSEMPPRHAARDVLNLPYWKRGDRLQCPECFHREVDEPGLHVEDETFFDEWHFAECGGTLMVEMFCCNCGWSGDVGDVLAPGDKTRPSAKPPPARSPTSTFLEAFFASGFGKVP